MNKRTVTVLSIISIALAVTAYILALNDIGLVSLAGASLGVFLVAWLMAIIMAVRDRQWIWLVVVLFLGVIGSLLYGTFGRELQAG